MSYRQLVISCVSIVLLWSSLGCEASDTRYAEGDSDSDSDSDGDSDSDSDGDTDTGEEDCTPGETFCYEGDVYDCTGPDNSMELVEECPSPLICMNGMCIDDDACGYALANKSNIGCEYWTIDMDNTTPTQPYAIAVSNLDAATAVVTVEQRNASGYVVLETASVESKQVHVFMLGDTTTPGSYLMTYKAFRVTSDLPVVAYQFNPYAGLQADNSDICTNDGSLLLATSGLDNFYYVMGYPTNAGSSSMDVVATQDGTTVKVTPANAMTGGSGVAALAAGVETTFVMNASDVLQLNSGSDVSGTYVESDKPVAVFGGNTCSFVPSSVSFCDHIEHQMFPVTTWGDDFVASHSPWRTAAHSEADYWRLIASEDGTVITTTPTVPGIPASMTAGQVVEVSANFSFHISASAPIMVAQILTGSQVTDYLGIDQAGGDPAMALLAPTAQFLPNYVFLAPEKYMEDYVVITHLASEDVMLDGVSVSTIGSCQTEAFDAEWNITRCLIPDFTHTLDGAEPFGATVWGYGGRVSYGYTAGLDLEVINPIIVE